MTDSCVIVRLGSGGTLDPSTGRIVKFETPIYNGKCRVSVEAGHSVGDVAAGETAVASVTPVVSVPVSVTDVQAGDRVKMTSSNDDLLANASLLVRSVKSGTNITARRLICEVL
jgi:Family of unknown function (DUF6093)